MQESPFYNNFLIFKDIAEEDDSLWKLYYESVMSHRERLAALRQQRSGLSHTLYHASSLPEVELLKSKSRFAIGPKKLINESAHSPLFDQDLLQLLDLFALPPEWVAILHSSTNLSGILNFPCYSATSDEAVARHYAESIAGKGKTPIILKFSIDGSQMVDLNEIIRLLGISYNDPMGYLNSVAEKEFVVFNGIPADQCTTV